MKRLLPALGRAALLSLALLAMAALPALAYDVDNLEEGPPAIRVMLASSSSAASFSFRVAEGAYSLVEARELDGELYYDRDMDYEQVYEEGESFSLSAGGGWLALPEDEDSRCSHCYDDRLSRAAAYAASQSGFDALTTTLLISPSQRHDELRERGEEFAAEHGLPFAYLDLRPGFRAGQAAARQAGLYMQKYCGCIYSEKERYCKEPKP